MIRAGLVCCLALCTAISPIPLAAQQRVPIDLGPDAPGMARPPQRIDFTAPPLAPEPAGAAAFKECDDLGEGSVVAGEIVVCRELEGDPAQLYSGSRAEWLRLYGKRTQAAGTIAPPDVDRTGLPGGITITGFCFLPPCPKDPALIIDVTAIAPPPAGSDAERVAQGLAPIEDDMAPLTEEARRRIDAQLGLPPAPER